jgi:hypothetical protein
MHLLLVLALLLGLPSSAHEHRWENKSKESQCELINKELKRAVKHGTITQREAEHFSRRCNNRKS